MDQREPREPDPCLIQRSAARDENQKSAVSKTYQLFPEVESRPWLDRNLRAHQVRQQQVAGGFELLVLLQQVLGLLKRRLNSLIEQRNDLLFGHDERDELKGVNDDGVEYCTNGMLLKMLYHLAQSAEQEPLRNPISTGQSVAGLVHRHWALSKIQVPNRTACGDENRVFRVKFTIAVTQAHLCQMFLGVEDVALSDGVLGRVKRYLTIPETGRHGLWCAAAHHMHRIIGHHLAPFLWDAVDNTCVFVAGELEADEPLAVQ